MRRWLALSTKQEQRPLITFVRWYTFASKHGWPQPQRGTRRIMSTTVNGNSPGIAYGSFLWITVRAASSNRVDGCRCCIEGLGCSSAIPPSGERLFSDRSNRSSLIRSKVSGTPSIWFLANESTRSRLIVHSAKGSLRMWLLFAVSATSAPAFITLIGKNESPLSEMLRLCSDD